MNYKRYSKEEFEKRGLDSPAARALAVELQDDVTREIHGIVLAAFQDVVQRLNAEGHNLQPDEIKLGDIAYRDVPTSDDECHLRLGCDVIISAGYAHLCSAEELQKMHEE